MDLTVQQHAWSIDDEKFAQIQDAVEGQNQEVPEGTEITIPKIQFGVSKMFTFNYDYTLRTEVDLNIRFEENNDVISSSFASINPALGFEFGYTDLVFLRAGMGNFQNELQIDNSEQLSFQPSFS